MQHKIIIIFLLCVVFICVSVVTVITTQDARIPVAQEQKNSRYTNATYMLDGEAVTLQNGQSVSETTGDVRVFGNELHADLDGDGDTDTAFVLTQTLGGSGTFYYAVATLRTEEGFVGTDGYLLGDRIAPQSTNLSPNPRHKNVVVFNYADRDQGEPMSTQPSIGKSVYLKVNPKTMQWGIVEPDFEGESALE